MMQTRLETRPSRFLGALPDARGTNFALFSANAKAVELCLFDDAGGRELSRLPLAPSDGIWSRYVPGIRPGQRYGYRVHGPYEPELGHRFNANKLLIDPYARKLDRSFSLCDTHFGYVRGDPAGDLSFDSRDSAGDTPKCVVLAEDRPDVVSGPGTSWARTTIYEAHPRGMTKLRQDIPAPWRGTLAGLASGPVIAHLRALGITALELMPVTAVADEPRLAELGLRNYWGYNPVGFFALEPRYCAGDQIPEFVTLVRALHDAGIELILDVVFNHTGEGDEWGPTFSYRGIDNASYYRLSPGHKRNYVDDSGCGNTLNFDHPRARDLVLDALRYWAGLGVDGFRFDLAVTLGRAGGRFSPEAPLLAAIAADPALSRLKLVAEPWDVGRDSYQFGAFRAPWREWNDRYRDTVRRFWRGDPGQTADFATRLAGSSDVMGGRGPTASINFVTAHDGFTLEDLVSYSEKRNWPNGEGNLDGAADEYSWNCGTEGPSADDKVRALRERSKRNLLGTLLLSLGVPMMRAGDELGQSANGNSNAYCQDNETTWLSWEPRREEDVAFLDFVRRVIALRRDHPVFRRSRHLSDKPASPPDVLWLRADGETMGMEDWRNPQHRCLACVLSCQESGAPLRRYALLFNPTEADVSFVVPRGPQYDWQILLDTEAADGGPSGKPATVPVRVSARSLKLLLAAA